MDYTVSTYYLFGGKPLSNERLDFVNSRRKWLSRLTNATFPTFVPLPHHMLVFKSLQRCVIGAIGYFLLMIVRKRLFLYPINH